MVLAFATIDSDAGAYAPVCSVAVSSWAMMSWSILRLTTAIDVSCMMRRWSPCEAKMLKLVFSTRSCHSASVHSNWSLASLRAGMSPLTPRVTAVAPPELATRNVALLPLITVSVTVQERSIDWRNSKPWMNSSRYWVWKADGVDMQSLRFRCLRTAASQGVRTSERCGMSVKRSRFIAARGFDLAWVRSAISPGPCGVSDEDRWS